MIPSMWAGSAMATIITYAVGLPLSRWTVAFFLTLSVALVFTLTWRPLR